MVEQRRRAVFNWSGGKDSALALQTVLREDRYEVVSLLTTVDASNDRSSMHGIPAELLRMQADSIFGDIFLQDVRAYRERQLEPYGVTVVEPLWGQGPERIMAAFLASGLETVVVTTDASCLGADWIGRTIDGTFRDDLPDGVDPCGENGEYHTFCHAGGMFRYPIPFRLGGPVRRSYTVTLEDGAVKSYAYWFAALTAP